MLTYSLKWLLWPSEATFQRVPEYSRPTPLQLVQEHHLAFDLPLWPIFRDNLIRHSHRIDLEEFAWVLACTFRIRGGFNKQFIVRENDGELQISEEFYQQFMNLENWGLLEGFWIKYPYLVEGLDPSIMLLEENLMPPP